MDGMYSHCVNVLQIINKNTKNGARIASPNERINFLIPNYQRLYTWKENETRPFIETLEELCKLAAEGKLEDDNYFGHMIIHENESENATFDIVDGQQRITTFTILFKVLLEEKGNVSHALYDQINAFIYNESNKPRLMHKTASETFFQQYVLLDCESIEKYIKKTNGFRMSFSDFSELSNIEKRRELVSVYKAQKGLPNELWLPIVKSFDAIQRFVTDNENKELIHPLVMHPVLLRIKITVTYAPSFRVAYEAYKSTNAKGKDLTDYELIKATILGENDELTQRWREFEATNTLPTTKMPDILKSILMIEYKKNSHKYIYDEFTELFKEKKFALTTREFAKEFFDHLESYSYFYRDSLNLSFHNALENKKFFKYNTEVTYYLKTPYSNTLPLFFKYFLKDNITNENEVVRILQTLYLFPFIHKTINGCRAENISNFVSKLIMAEENVTLNEVLNEVLEDKKYQSISEFKRNLKKADIKKNEIASLILMTIEDPYRKDEKGTLTVEHIYAKKKKKINPEEDIFEKEIKKSKKIINRQYVNNIANFLLLEEDLNKSASNSAILNKIDFYKESDLKMPGEFCTKYYYNDNKSCYSVDDFFKRQDDMIEKLSTIILELNLIKEK